MFFKDSGLIDSFIKSCISFFNIGNLISWLDKNKKTVVIFFSVLALFGLIFLTNNWWKQEQEYKNQVFLYKFKASLKNFRKEDDSKKPFDLLSKEEPEDKLILTEDMKKKASAYEQAVRQNQKFQTTAAFAVDLADFYYRYGKKDQAKDLLSLFALPLKKDSVYHLAVFQLTGYYMNEKDCKQALPLLSQLISNESAAAFHLEGRLQKTICLEFENRHKEALEEYEKISIEKPDSYMGRLAKDYKRLLILKEKLKK